jgi:transposase
MPVGDTITITAEIQDFHRFVSPRQLMAYLGLVPSEDASSTRRRKGAITKAGNSAARRMLVEVAHHYRSPARVSPIIAKRQAELSKAVTDIAWAAQLRLCERYRRLAARRVPTNKIVVAIARELTGFIWDIARHVAPAPEQVAKS